MNVDESLNIGYRIAKIIHTAIETTPNITNYWEEHFKDGPNPFYNQMESGIRGSPLRKVYAAAA